jgi:hypothetical protein
VSRPVAPKAARPAAPGARRIGAWLVRVRRGALAAGLLLLPACYATRLTTTSRIAPGERVAIDVNDQGRAALGERIGPEIRRLGGTYLGESNGEIELRVMDVTDLNGSRTTWSGESIKLRREHVKDMYERRFSRARTAVVVGVVAAGLVAFIATRGLFGFGPGGPGDDGGGGGNQQ